MTISVDFDGVIHTYDRGWADGSIYGDFTADAVSALETLMARDAVFVHTTRNPRQVARWIERTSWHSIDCTTHLPRTWYGRRNPFWNTRGLLLVTDRKLPATVYIDDRAHHFETWAKTMVTLGEPAELWPDARVDVCGVESVGGDRCTREAGHRQHSFEINDPARAAIRRARGDDWAPQRPKTETPVGYSGKGRVWCLSCPHPDDENAPITVDLLQPYEQCAGCGRHVVEVARAVVHQAEQHEQPEQRTKVEYRADCPSCRRKQRAAADATSEEA